MSTIITNNIYFDAGENTQPGTPSDPSPNENPMPNPKDPSKPNGAVKKAVGLATMAQLGKSALGYATSHVAVFSGSSDKQDKVNAIMGIAGTAVAIAANPALGLAMAAFNLATKAMDYAYKQKWDTLNTQQTRLRAGPSLNKSRLN